jgi:Skp family chaperone for outer membrane proteins
MTSGSQGRSTLAQRLGFKPVSIQLWRRFTLDRHGKKGVLPMVVSTRGILAIAFGAAGLAFLVGPSLGQQQDGTVRKTASPTGGTQPPPAVPPIIGTVDIDAVFKGYDKFKVANKEFSAALMARQNEMMKLKNETQEEVQMLAKLTPGTEDYRRHENKVTDLKARFEAGREQAQREFALREAENVATIYKEVQQMVVRWAKYRGMNYVLKYSDPQKQQITGADPNSVMNAISSAVVYADPQNDITNDVIYNLNRMYEKMAAPRPKAATENPAQAARPAETDRK